MDAKRKEEDSKAVVILTAVVAAALAGGAYFGYRYQVQAPKRLAAHTLTWFESPREMAQAMLERHGPPSALAPNVATWYEREPWKRITVHGDSADRYLEQAVGYRARPGAVAPLREFNRDVRLDLIREELSVRSNSEALNFLALNLADEVATGKRSPKAAREFYARTEKLAAAGKSSPYLEKILFEPYRFIPQERALDMMGY